MLRNRLRTRVLLPELIALVAVIGLVGCGSTRVAEDGDSVTVHYHGTLDDGSVFDSSRERDPLPFVVGSGGVISGFDNAVRGLAVGESVTVRMKPAEAYGERDESLVLEFPASDAPKRLGAGDQVSVSGRTAVVLEVTDEIVRIDANHELAGQALTFEIELVSIE
jgi:FKBP-type peptidyl-prolyl cis-trans isomerase 2